jgi:hypothetical protein
MEEQLGYFFGNDDLTVDNIIVEPTAKVSLYFAWPLNYKFSLFMVVLLV